MGTQKFGNYFLNYGMSLSTVLMLTMVTRCSNFGTGQSSLQLGCLHVLIYIQWITYMLVHES